MAERRANQDQPKYREINRRIKQRCKEEKEEWYNSLCGEVEAL